MSNKNGSKWIRPEKRLAIYARDGFACIYCAADEGERPLTLDHILARELDGTNEADNLVTCCLKCNSRKQKLSMRKWFALLRDSGVDTSRIAKRIRKHTARNLDLDLGLRLLNARKGGGGE